MVYREVRSSRNVTSGPEEVIKAVDLLGGVLAGLGIDIEALKSTLRIPPPPPPQQIDAALRQDVCWHRSIMSARRRWNSFRRSFRRVLGML